MTCLNHASLAASLAALTVAADAAAASKPKSPAGKRPAVIVIMTDQQTAGAISCAGNPWVRTPAMDALAADGVRFTRAYCPYPLSGPCRAALVTGRMPFEVGASDNAIRPADADMQAGIGHRLAEAGYECLYAGKWHVPEVNLPDSGTGFRRISKMNDPALADACDAALKEYDGQKPLFLVASLLNPHEICEYGRHETLQYGELAPFSTEECPNLPANFMPSTYAAEALTLEHASSPRYHDTYTYTQDDWRRYLYAYYRLVERADREVGRIVGVLKAHGLYDDAAIVFLSDHGDGAAAHGWNQKWNLQEEVINVPLIVKPPKGAGPGGACATTRRCRTSAWTSTPRPATMRASRPTPGVTVAGAFARWPKGVRRRFTTRCSSRRSSRAPACAAGASSARVTNTSSTSGAVTARRCTTCRTIPARWSTWPSIAVTKPS